MLNAIFTSNMVFPAGKRFRVFGDGDVPKAVTLWDKTATIKTEDKMWIAEFEPMEYGGGYELKGEYTDNTTTLENIYVGEVYLCAGQSNMQFKMWESTTKKRARTTTKSASSTLTALRKPTSSHQKTVGSSAKKR